MQTFVQDRLSLYSVRLSWVAGNHLSAANASSLLYSSIASAKHDTGAMADTVYATNFKEEIGFHEKKAVPSNLFFFINFHSTFKIRHGEENLLLNE